MSCDTKGISSQNTQIFVKKVGDTDYLLVGKVKTLGNLSARERNVIETDLLNCNEVAKSLGSIKRGSIDVTYLYDENLPDGHDVLDEAGNRAEGTIYLDVRIELANKQTEDGHGTQFDFGAIVPKLEVGNFTKDGMVEATATLSITTDATVTKST
jgi:hypothetical protein